MAAKPRGPGRPFPKGKTGNPKGSSARKRELKEIASLTNAEVQEVGALILKGNRAALTAIGQDKDASVLKVWTAGLVVSSMKNGDAGIYRAILERLLGKPKETLVHSGPDGAPIQHQTERVTMTYEQKIERLAALRRQREAAGK